MPFPMWKVFGVDENVIESGVVWKEQLLELSKKKKGRPRFLEMMGDSKVSYWFDSIQELHVFYIELPESYGTEDLEFMKSFIIKIIKSTDEPVISLFDEPQRFTVVITSEKEEDVYRGIER